MGRAFRLRQQSPRPVIVSGSTRPPFPVSTPLQLLHNTGAHVSADTSNSAFLAEDSPSLLLAIKKQRIAILNQLKAVESQDKEEEEGNEYLLTFPGILQRTNKKIVGWKILWPRIVNERGRRRLRFAPVIFKTPNRHRKFELFTKVLINPWFAIGCGLTATESFLAAITATTIGQALILPFFLSVSFLFFHTLVNWQNIQKHIPVVFAALTTRKGLTRLFQYSEAEYQNLLKEFWVDRDDRITQARRDIKKFNALLAQRGELSWWQVYQRQYAMDELKKLLLERQQGIVPAKQLSWNHRAIFILSLPLHIAGGFMLGLFTYHLTISTLMQTITLILGSAFALTTPPGWIIGIAIFLVLVTAPTITGIFMYGSSSLLKVYQPARKMWHFFTNLFKTEQPNPDGPGTIKTVTPWSAFRGLGKLAIIASFVGFILFGNVQQMLGGGALLSELFKDALLISALPIMAMIIHFPFYMIQASKIARSWFKDTINYFRDPFKVLDEKIEKIQALKLGQAIGSAKAYLMIEKFKMEKHKLLLENDSAEKKWHLAIFIPIPGKWWVKLPFWVRDILAVQVSRSFNTASRSFLTYWGAVSGRGILLPNDGNALPDTTLFSEATDKPDLAMMESYTSEKIKIGGQRNKASPLPTRSQAFSWEPSTMQNRYFAKRLGKTLRAGQKFSTNAADDGEVSGNRYSLFSRQGSTCGWSANCTKGTPPKPISSA